jgi:hypothetical protein
MQQTRTFVIRALIAFAIAHGAAAQTAPTVVISPVPMIQFFDNSGRPLAGGCVATYQAGTTTPLQTFKDSTGMVANQNPVMLDASGRAPIWINVNAIKYVVKAKSSACSLSSGTVLYTTDGVQDQGLRLRTDLAGVNGAGNIGIQQPGGIPITVQGALSLCPDASQYASLAVAIANAVPSGCLNYSSVLTGTAVTIPSHFVLNCQPGSSIANASAAATLTLNASAQNITLNGCNVSNSGGPGISSPTSCTNCTITGGSVSTGGGNFPIVFNGSWSNIHISGVAVSDTGNDTSGGGSIMLHCGPSGTSHCDGAWVESNTITHATQAFGIEVGCFCVSPYPAPTNVHVLKNHIVMATGYSIAFSGAVSMSTAANSEVGGNSLDTGGTAPVGIPYETTVSAGMNVHDNTWFNPAPATSVVTQLAPVLPIEVVRRNGTFLRRLRAGASPSHLFFDCDGCTNSVFHHNIGQGFAYVISGGDGGTGAKTVVSRIEVSGNVLMPPSDGDYGIDVACNGANDIDSINVHDNLAVGPTPNTAGYGLVLVNNTGCSYTNVTSENNLFDGFHIGALASLTPGANPVRYLHNTYLNISGSVYSGSSTPATQTDNNQPWVIPQSISAPGISLTGTPPTFTAGAGAGTGAAALACLSTIICSPFRGAVFLTTGTAPAANGLMFSINVAAGFYSVRPVCVVGGAPTSQITQSLVYDNVGSTPTRLDFYVFNGTAPAAANVVENYVCMQ